MLKSLSGCSTFEKSSCEELDGWCFGAAASLIRAARVKCENFRSLKPLKTVYSRTWIWERAAGCCQVQQENSLLSMSGQLRLTKEPSCEQKKYWKSVKFSNNVFEAHCDADIYLVNNVARASVLNLLGKMEKGNKVRGMLNRVISRSWALSKSCLLSFKWQFYN